VQAYKWFTVIITGRDSHTGTTAFEHRQDALLEAAYTIVALRRMANKLGCLASVGIIEARPGSVNTVPGWVRLSVDLRAATDAKLDELVKRFKDISPSQQYQGRYGVSRQIELDFESPATKFHDDCIRCVEAAASTVAGEKVRKMISGAGHDSVFTNKRCPTSMIFVPCRDGVSHHPAEFSSPEDGANGASVLLGAVVRYDRERKDLV